MKKKGMGLERGILFSPTDEFVGSLECDSISAESPKVAGPNHIIISLRI